jgi:hypothetical protein
MTTDDKAQLHVGVPDILVGTWTYRSLLSTPDVNADFDSLEFGRGNIEIREAPLQTFDGRIYGPGWQLELKGSIAYGNPFALRFQGRGVVGGAEWVYDYKGYYVPEWVNGVDQRPALIGSYSTPNRAQRKVYCTSGCGCTVDRSKTRPATGMKKDYPYGENR